MFGFPPIEVDGKRIEIVVVQEKRRNANAGIAHGSVVIKLPLDLDRNELFGTALSLYKRMKLKIEREGASKRYLNL